MSSARDVPQQGEKRSNIYAHVRLDDRLICLSEHEVRDQDINERLHFDQGEALAYAGLQGNAFVKCSHDMTGISYARSSGECQRVGVETW